MNPRVFIVLVLLHSAMPRTPQAAPAPKNNLPFAIAFATWDQLFMAVGRYQPGKGFQDYKGFVRATHPGDLFTLYTMDGEVAQVRNTEEKSTEDWRAPIEWSAAITRWAGYSDTSFAIALSGVSPVKADPALALPLDRADLVARVAAYLKSRKLDVPAPYLTQAFEVTLSPGEPPVYLVCAHSDASALRNEEAAAVYALALIITDKKIIPLAQQTSWKTRDQTIEEYQRYNGTRDFNRFVAVLDLDGDQHKELMIYAAKWDASQVDVFSLKRGRYKAVLSSFKHLYN